VGHDPPAGDKLSTFFFYQTTDIQNRVPWLVGRGPHTGNRLWAPVVRSAWDREKKRKSKRRLTVAGPDAVEDGDGVGAERRTGDEADGQTAVGQAGKVLAADGVEAGAQRHQIGLFGGHVGRHRVDDGAAVEDHQQPVGRLRRCRRRRRGRGVRRRGPAAAQWRRPVVESARQTARRASVGAGEPAGGTRIVNDDGRSHLLLIRHVVQGADFARFLFLFVFLVARFRNSIRRRGALCGQRPCADSKQSENRSLA